MYPVTTGFNFFEHRRLFSVNTAGCSASTPQAVQREHHKNKNIFACSCGTGVFCFFIVFFRLKAH